MSEIINWLRKESIDFALVVLDFGVQFEYMQENYPANRGVSMKDHLADWITTLSSGEQHLVPISKAVTIEELKEVIKKRYEVESSDHLPYVWKPLVSGVDVLSDADDDGRAIIFHSIKNYLMYLGSSSPNMENTCITFGNSYVKAYRSLQKK